MKRSIFGAAVLALALSASTAQAQRPFSVGIGLGATMPQGNFADLSEMGYHGLLTLGFSPPALPVGVRIDGQFNQLGTKDDVADFNWRVMSLTANATLGMPMAASPISPYIIGGLGIYQLSTDNSDLDDLKESKLGFNVGVGTKFALAGFGTFAEIRYHRFSVEADGSDSGDNIAFIPITFGITF